MELRTFREAYTVLQDHAQTLRDQTEPNIDDLLTIVTESVAAYKVCKERIDAVEKALQEALTGVATEAQRAPPSEGDEQFQAEGRRAPRSTPKQKSGFDDMDDDIPF